MKILVIGGGGREHAIAWRLENNGHEVYACPGNPGIRNSIAGSDYLAVARELGVDLTVVGPEAPLVAGVVDQFRAAGLAIAGPNASCARLEASKMYSKQFMHEAGIPTARFARTSDRNSALRALDEFTLPVVVKADGLAAGKGVIIAATREEAVSAVDSLGPLLVIEEFLVGEEVSFIALCDGKTVVPLEATQDHKTIFDGDTGPNTGGMGAYCDGRILTAEQSAQIVRDIMQPTVSRLCFSGFLYAGLMMTAAGPKVLEFNVRLGDPETQALMHRMDCDFGELLLASAQGRLEGHGFAWRQDPSVCVVMSAHGYPATPRSGDRIDGLAAAEATGATVFHAGTKRLDNGDIVTSGGRVLGVTASGATLPDAMRNAYKAVECIHFDGAHFRRDIAAKGLRRWQ